MATAFSDYTSSAGAQTGPSAGEETGANYWSLDRLKRSYTDYLNSKTDEVEEQKNARRYRHASQWTAEQIKVLNKRKQPVVTYNRIGRKIDGVVGLIEKLKQSPKAFPRTPKESQGADLATAVIRSVLDEAEWKAKAPIVAESGAVDGIGGIELLIEPGDRGDPTVNFEVVDIDGFFYDPRSYKRDFADCRFMGQGKWFDLDAARELFPEQADQLEDAMESATDLSTNSDRENKWFITDGSIKRIRIVEEWYLMNGEWYWCVYTGNMKLQEGASYLHDEKGKTFCKYIMFSAGIDQDGDRYGFVRNLKSAQDEINQRRSKALHLLNTRRIVAEQGAFDDVEIARREAARPDGIIIRNKGFEAEFDDTAKIAELNQQMEFMVDAKAEIENFGPNPALIGQGALGDKSGRAIQLLQQAGVAELGPFLTGYRGWKIRVYRAVWNAVREHWKAERYIRVTDDQNVLQFIGVNQVGINPETGMPAMVNQLGALDVDIIMDEGPDTINMMADTYDALLAIAQNGANVPPDVLIELAPGIDHDTKKRLVEKLSAPNPMMQLQQAQLQADVAKTQADTELSKAKAVDTMRGDQAQGENPMVTMAEVENKMADTAHKKAQALKTMQEAVLAPQQAEHDQNMDVADRTMPEPKEDFEMRKHQDEIELKRAQLALEREARQQELQFKHAEAEREREMKREETGNTELAKLGYSSLVGEFNKQQTSFLERIEKSIEKVANAVVNVDSKVDRLAENVDEMAKEIDAPVTIDRDERGRAKGVQKGKKYRSVGRDKSGRAVSLR